MSRAKQKAQPGTMKKVLEYLRPYMGLVVLSVLLAAVTVALTLYVPVLIGRAIDLIVGPGQVDMPGILRLILRIAIVVAATAAVQWVVNTINNKITFQVVRDVRAQAFAKLQILPLSYIDSHPTGEIVSRVIADVDQFADGLLLGFTQLFTGVVTILGTLGFMISIRPGIALVVVLLTPLSFVVARFIATHTYSYFRQQSETRGEQTAFIDEMIGNQKVVKAFGHEQQNVERFDEINERLEKCSLQAIFYSSLTNPCTRFVNNVVYAGVALAGALVCVACGGAGFTVGSLSALLSYANQYTKPFNEISGVVTELQNALACASRIFQLIAEPPQTPDAPDARVLKDAQGQVEMKDVSFSYVPDRKLIEALNLSVKPGQHVAIVGPTGCGKTTLINLLMRFYDINDGQITVDDHDIRHITRKSLRGAYSMVLQDTWLFSGTIYENIAYARPDATREEVIEAAKAAKIHHYIMSLPQGYDTVITDDGANISKGQKQLMTIARAMLVNAHMLILDEATSNVDTRTEVQIQQAMRRLMRDKTCFVVAHRLSTIKNADLILVVRGGNVVESGTHRELMAKGGFYREMYDAQFH